MVWTEEDRRWAFALLEEEAEECPGCRGQLKETTDPENEFRYEVEAIRCHKCKTQQKLIGLYSRPPNDPTGILVTTSLQEVTP